MAKLVSTDASKEIYEFDAAIIELAAEALRRCEQEQWRQREASKLFLHRRFSESDLRDVSESWNGAGPKPVAQACRDELIERGRLRTGLTTASPGFRSRGWT
jgi:hypothetical protein